MMDDCVSGNFFSSPYQGEAHKELIKYAKACLAAFQEEGGGDKYVAACFAFLQSSGYGKTRTLMEVASTELLIHVSARHPTSSGFPRHDTLACIFFQLDPNNGWFRCDADPHLDLRMRLLVLYKTALNPKWDMLGEEGKRKQFNGAFRSFWDTAQVEFYKLCPRGWENYNVARAVFTKLIGELANQRLVFLAMDKASVLIDIPFPGEEGVFGALRWAMRDLQLAGIQMVLVYVDVNPIICTTSRPKPVAQGAFSGLFPPFILRGTLDVLRAPRGLGRPLVAEYNSDYGYLQSKVMGAFRMRESGPDGMLAVILARVAARISPQSRLSERLVTTHMATLLAASFDCDAFLVTYVSEPPLAAAVSLLWDDYLKQVLPVFRKALINGLVSTDWEAALVAQIVCLAAFDSQCDKDVGSRLKKYISLDSFLQALPPPPNGQDDNTAAKVAEFIPAQHKDATLSVLQFVQLPDGFELSKEELQNLYVRQTACVLPQRGANLLIPYKYGVDEYSFVLLQTGLNEPHPRHVFAEEEMASMQCTRIRMHLARSKGEASEAREDLMDTDFGCKALDLYGIEFRCIVQRDGLVEELTRLLKASPGNMEILETAMSQYESDGAPLPEGNSLAGFSRFLCKDQPI